MSKYNVKRMEKGVYGGDEAEVNAVDVRIICGDLIFTKEQIMMTTRDSGIIEMPPSGIVRAFATGRWAEMELIEGKKDASS